MMKKYLPLFILALFIAAPYASIAQCTIDTTNTRVGFTPGTPAVVKQNIAYQQTVQVYIPTTYSGLQLDSLHVDSITGMPNGIVYTLNPASGTVLAGTGGAFCFSGSTSDTVGPYPLTFYGYVYTTAQAIPFSALAAQVSQFGYTLRVEAQPGALFSVDSPVCSIMDSVTFVDHTTGYPTRWAWTFQGGSPATSTLQFPHVLFDTTGVLQVRLIARNGVGSDTIIQNITVFPGMTGSLATTSATSATAADGSATITVSQGTPPFTYRWSNGGNDSSITNVVAGLYNVSVNDSKGCQYVNDTVFVNYTTGISPVAGASPVKLYPNPAADKVFVSLPQAADVYITIVDITSKEVLQFESKNTATIALPVNSLPAGTYLLRIANQGKGKPFGAATFVKL